MPNEAPLPALVAVSPHGRRLAAHVAGRLVQGTPREALVEAWRTSREIVFFGATGIAVRLAAPLLAGKTTDPALVVVDDAGRFAISIISGHEGGANALARRVAAQIGAEAVITTATEVLPDRDLVLGVGCSTGASFEEIETLARSALAEAGASLESVLELASIDVKRDEPGLLAFAARWHLPARWFTAAELAAVPVPNPSSAVASAVGTASVAEAAALLAAGGSLGALPPEPAGPPAQDGRLGRPGAAELPAVRGTTAKRGARSEASLLETPAARSEASVPATSGARPEASVPAALGARSEASVPATLVVPKHTSARVTVAVARRARAGHLAVIGLGPGGRAQLTGEALEALRQADVVVGYTLYTDMVREWLPLATCESLPLGEEVARARRAIALARECRRVALVSSGDAGIYALAGLVYEQLADETSLDVQVIPGVTAATSAAALLGAPLMADFVTLSLSDLHVPEEVIRRRLRAAAEADLVAVLYNPASTRRRQLLAEARDIFLASRPPATPVGLVRNAYRPGQTVRIHTLESLPLDNVDMFTLVVVGGSQTEVIGGRMVTRRQSK